MALICAMALPSLAQTGSPLGDDACALGRANKLEMLMTPGEVMRRDSQRYYTMGGAAPDWPSAGFPEVGAQATRILERGVAPCQLDNLQRILVANQNAAWVLATANSESEALNLMGAMAYNDQGISGFLMGMATPGDNGFNAANIASYANLMASQADYCQQFQPALTSAERIATRMNLANSKINILKMERWQANNAPSIINTITEEMRANFNGSMALSDQAQIISMPVAIGQMPIVRVYPNGLAMLPESASSEERVRWYYENEMQKPQFGRPSDNQNDFYYYPAGLGGPLPSVGGIYTEQFGDGTIQSVGGFFSGKVNMCGAGLSGPSFGSSFPLTHRSSNAAVPCNSDIPGATPCFLAAVSLSNDNGNVQCSGTLVSPTWVLTAAHCVCRGDLSRAHIGQATPTRENQRARSTASANVLSEACFFGDTECQKFGVQKAGPFCREDQAIDDQTLSDLMLIRAHYRRRDLALINLNTPLRFDQTDDTPESYRQAAITTPLGHPDADLSGQVLAVAGFGINDDEPFGGVKSYAPIRLDSFECDPETGCISGQEFILADPEGSIDSCGGDSGAGVYGPSTEMLALYGVVSRGTGTGCGPGGINTRVAMQDVIDWIHAVTDGASRVVNAEIPDENPIQHQQGG